MSNPKSLQRLLAGAGIALCAIALPAAAQSEQAAPSTPATASTTAMPGADAQTISRDPGTGQLRNATPQEQANLQAMRTMKQARIAPKPVLQKYHASGAAGLRLSDQYLSSSVAVRTPDGQIQMICNEPHGADAPAAPHIHAAPAPVTE